MRFDTQIAVILKKSFPGHVQVLPIDTEEVALLSEEVEEATAMRAEINNAMKDKYT